MERWRGGEMERWRDREVERWRDREIERWRGGGFCFDAKGPQKDIVPVCPTLDGSLGMCFMCPP